MSGKKIVRNALAALTIGTSLLAHASTPEPIRHSVTIKASQADVWQRWTTDDGLRTFFSRASNIDLQVGGDYFIYLTGLKFAIFDRKHCFWTGTNQDAA